MCDVLLDLTSFGTKKMGREPRIAILSYPSYSALELHGKCSFLPTQDKTRGNGLKLKPDLFR